MAANRRADPIERARDQWIDNGLGGVDEVIAMTSLVRANQILEARLEEVLQPLGLNLMRYSALSMLSFSEDGRRIGRVAWGLMIHPATVTTVVDRLERDGLAERHNHATDRRARMVIITPEGRKLVALAHERLIEAGFGLSGLSTDEAVAITDALRPLRRAAGDIPTQ